MDSLDLKHAKSVLIKLSKMGAAKKSDLFNIVKSHQVLDNLLELLKKDGYINISESKMGPKRYSIVLTDTGRAVAEKLQEAQDVAEGKPPQENEELDLRLTDEEAEKAKRSSLLYHVNVSDDHVTVQEIIPDKPSRIFNIYIKRNGGGNFRLWCERDDSYDCWHVKTAWTYPQVQQMMIHYKGKTRICLSCNYENPEEAQYCMHCGARLE
ncbi:zinc-ribbon domain-containing protein [Ferroplasma sp.]|uniref:zinc-ribbon domain-containing protein n=1 Tax=Ferroplasma sp. TaxID=2591003 RepID=UPI00262F57DB|nr:zinc-ribbon domain-containing protein [Ferroplasma sp.]